MHWFLSDCGTLAGTNDVKTPVTVRADILCSGSAIVLVNTSLVSVFDYNGQVFVLESVNKPTSISFTVSNTIFKHRTLNANLVHKCRMSVGSLPDTTIML